MIKKRKGDDQRLNDLEQISVRYSKTGDFRSAIQLLPFGVGSAIDSFFGRRAEAINQRRIEAFFEKCHEDINKLGENKIDKDFIKSDDFYFFCKNIFNNISDEIDSDKLVYYKNIFLGKINIENDIEDDFRSICVEVLKKLSVSQIQILSACFTLALESKIDSPGTPLFKKEDTKSFLRLKKSLSHEFWLRDVNLPKFKQDSALLINVNILCDSGLLKATTDQYEESDYELSKFGSDFIYTVLIDQV